jgi:PHD/YefM family antitoxin component YafN of YafNO toxin-antitoxin module
MDIAKRYRPISYLKTNADEIAKELADETDAVIITEHGIPSFVCVSFEEYYRTREINALVKLIQMGEQEMERGEYKSLSEAREFLDEQILHGKGHDKADE